MPDKGDNLKFALNTHKSSLEFEVARLHGCIRMSEELNNFLAGEYLLVVDSVD